MVMFLFGLILATWSGLDYQATVDAAAIQGTWKVVSVRYAGLGLAEPDWQFTRFVFAGDKVLLDGAEQSEEGHFEFLSASSRERRCDFWLNVHRFKRMWLRGRMVQGTVYSLDKAEAIYRLEGDGLKLCLVWNVLSGLGGCPSEFKTHRNDLRWLYVLERE